MKDGEYVNEYCKYVFTESEKKELAIVMAQKVSELAAAEDQKKAIMSDFKSQIDGLQAKVNGNATKLNNGYEMRTIKCRVLADYDLKEFCLIREDNGEVAKRVKMKAEDLQTNMFDK